MKTEKQDIDSREYLLEALDDPTTSPSELKDLLSDPECEQDGRLLQDCRTVFVRQHFASKIDTDKVWEDFKRKRSKKYYILIGFSSIAASIILFFIISKFNLFTPVSTNNDIVVFSPKTTFGEIILSTSSGQQLSLDRIHQDSTLSFKGINAEKEKLTYSNSAPQEPEIHTVTTAQGSFFHLQLCDGTQVWLNAESRLTYPNFFNNRERIVQLEGEGYFKVAPDSSRPFQVKTDQIITEVLGTEFNVRTYDLKDSHITLLKGCVKVKHLISAEEAFIQPGEDAHLLENASWEIKPVDTDHYYLWTEGYFYFDNQSLVEIMREIGRWYNVKIVFKNKEVMNLRFHFLAQRDQEIEHALKLLNQLGNVNASYHNNVVTIE